MVGIFRQIRAYVLHHRVWLIILSYLVACGTIHLSVGIFVKLKAVDLEYATLLWIIVWRDRLCLGTFVVLSCFNLYLWATSNIGPLPLLLLGQIYSLLFCPSDVDQPLTSLYQEQSLPSNVDIDSTRSSTTSSPASLLKMTLDSLDHAECVSVDTCNHLSRPQSVPEGVALTALETVSSTDEGDDNDQSSTVIDTPVRSIGEFESQMVLPTISEEQFMTRGNTWVMVRVRKLPEGREPCEVKINREPHQYRLMLGYEVADTQGRQRRDCLEGIFDQVFPPACSQVDVTFQIQPMIDAAIAGQNITVIADGHSGSGKSYTMLGSLGVMYAAFSRLEGHLAGLVTEGWKAKIEVAALEIHCDKAFDLLANRTHRTPRNVVKSRGQAGDTYAAQDLKFKEIADLLSFRRLVLQVDGLRTKRPTSLNSESSRSHTIFTIQMTRTLGLLSKHSTLVFVDLAGREHIEFSTAVEREETQQIGIGRSGIKDLIIARGRSTPGSTDLKYNTLTKLTKECLSSRNKVLLLTCIDPSVSQYRNTKFTLDYARDIQKVAFQGRHTTCRSRRGDHDLDTQPIENGAGIQQPKEHSVA